jgi:hypothetical protein
MKKHQTQFQIVYRWRHKEKRHAAYKHGVLTLLNSWWINHYTVKAYVGRRCCLMPRPLLLRMHWIRHSSQSPCVKWRHSTLSPYFTWNYITELCRHTLLEITSQYSVAILYIKLSHGTLSPYLTWNYVTVFCRHTLHEITSRYSVPILYMKLRHNSLSPYMKLPHSTLSPYFEWNYFAVLCSHTLREITSQYSVAILSMKLPHNTVSLYFTWNYRVSRFEQLTLLLRILEDPPSYFGPVTSCPAECLVIFLSLSM